MVSCPHCGTQDAHFAKPLSVYVTKEEANKQIQLNLAQNFTQQMTMQQQQQVIQSQPPTTTFLGSNSTPNNVLLQGQACGGAVGGSGILGSGVLTSAAVGGGLRVHRVNSA